MAREAKFKRDDIVSVRDSSICEAARGTYQRVVNVFLGFGEPHFDLGDRFSLKCDDMDLVYRPDTGVMDAFAADENTSPMLELAQEQGKFVCVAGSSVFIDGDEDRCRDRLSSGTLHPESALRLLRKHRDDRSEVRGVNGTIGYTTGVDPGAGDFTAERYRMSNATLEHFSHPDVQAWMRERVKERPEARFYEVNGKKSVAISIGSRSEYYDGSRWETLSADGLCGYWDRAIRDGRAFASGCAQPLSPVTTAKKYQELFGKPAPVGMFEAMTQAIDGEEPAPRSGGMIGTDSSTGLLTFRSYKTGEMTVISLRESQPMSNSCASCGDALHPEFDAPVMHKGQRVHSSCAARLGRMKAESAPVVPKRDPYLRCREDEALVTKRMQDRGLRSGRSAFKADQVPEYRESVVHPWHCDESEP